MSRQLQLSCTMTTSTADTLPITNRQQLFSCTMVQVETGDFLKDNADNMWFIMGAYFFAFFPWAILNNIDFISEKWRFCSRTRTLAHIHFAGSILPIIYVALYAEAQRRDEDYKEFGAALAAIMFNVFQLLRTVMGLMQLNAFVAWCKDAKECLRVLCRKYDADGESDGDSDAETCEKDFSPGAQSSNIRCMQETRKFWCLFDLKKLGTWCKRATRRIRSCMCRNTENSEHETIQDEEDDVGSQNSYLMGLYQDKGEDLEKELQVNNTVIDNELGGREVRVLPSGKKIVDGIKKWTFKPSRWLWTDRVMLNTVRWCGVFLCAVGEHWSAHKHASAEDDEMMKKFFSLDMYDTRRILQSVEWTIDTGSDGPELISIGRLAAEGPTELTGEMSTAYGTGFKEYRVGTTWNVDLYSFEFDALVSSYPADETKYRSGNRESAKVGLAHSLVLAKHFGIEKLKAIRQYYEHYGVPIGFFRGNAFKLLCKQTRVDIPEDSEMWGMFACYMHRLPLFPYKMQAVALWEEATNWRVLQASAHQDIENSLYCGSFVQMNDNEEPLHNAPGEVNIFDYCADWSKKQDTNQGLLGLVIETVRTFLAEWIAGSEEQPNWEPEIPKNYFEFDRIGTISEETENNEAHLIWVCQRELQRMVAKMEKKDENFAGSAALIMLLLLGFPVLKMKMVQDSEVSWKENQEQQGVNGVISPNRDNTVDVSVQMWRAWTILAPQNISLMIRVDFAKRTVGLKLRNDCGDARFKWQDWVDAAMGYLKGIEEKEGSDLGYGRTIVKADLRKPMMELSPLPVLVSKDGIEPAMGKTGTVKIWMGWLPFDVKLCKFELDQWFAACNAVLHAAMKKWVRVTAEYEESRIESVIRSIVWEDNSEVNSSPEGVED